MARLRSATIMISALVAGCRLFDGAAGTYVRLRNATQWTMTELVVATGGGQIRVDRLLPGETSPYVLRDGAYSYGFVRVVTNGGKERRIIPVDFFRGQRPLPKGLFTFVLKVSGTMPDSLDLGIVQGP